MSDEFFDDEQELMRTADEATEEGVADTKPSDTQEPAREAPPFWMVLAIAAIALILGVVIGYLVGSQATFAQLSAASSETAQTSVTGSLDVLPEGHPDISIDEDSTATLADAGSASS